MPREIDYNKVDMDVLDEIDVEIIQKENFKKIKHKKKFDDGTSTTKNPKKRKEFFYNKNKKD